MKYIEIKTTFKLTAKEFLHKDVQGLINDINSGAFKDHFIANSPKDIKLKDVSTSVIISDTKLK